ncbi:MAG: hypothetical protein J6332_01935 [Abditibacteriota bacterium]|nr:hypothetical protein [Abditibacteriota bacterium]MBP5739092.1 hypothetical protein [Abditibacteriota bacterium]
MSDNVEASNPDLSLDEHKAYIDEFGYAYIEGAVKNNTNENYPYAEIEFNFYDDDDAFVGKAIDNTTDLEAGGTWEFKAVSLGDVRSADKYALVILRGMKL